MPRLTTSCPLCEKPLVETETVRIGDEIFHTYKCGHAFSDEMLALAASSIDFTSVDGSKKARPYQENGVEFVLGTGEYESYADLRGHSCIIADQMRLGKTPQSLIALKNLRKEHKGEKPFKCLILVRSANLWQWIREYKVWVDPAIFGIYPIIGSKSFLPSQFDTYICSMDTFARKGVMEQFLAFGFDLCIVDEAHAFKNESSKRSQALIAFLKQINRSELKQDVPFTCMMCKHTWMETVTVKVELGDNSKRVRKSSACPSCHAYVVAEAAKHVKVTRNCDCILLSGTPIKNRADEYFVPLNIVAPEKFPSLAHFRKDWLTQNEKGQWSRVKPYRLEEFRKIIAPYVLRREKEDVYTDLPKRNRLFTVISIEDERLKKAYNAVLDKLEQMTIEAGRELTYFESIGELMILRQICGLAKVNFVSNYAETFLMDSEKAKLAIGYHHHSVRDALKYQLDTVGCCKLDGKDSAERKDYIAHKYFQHAPEQILLLGMMAAKEGLELPYIDYALVLEREFTSTDEEQFEYRFYNPDKDYLEAKGINREKVTTIEYIIAQKTIDEWMYNLVEAKREVVEETTGNGWSLQDNPKMFKELLSQTMANRL